ncbi:MAG: DUF441 domain-containing protein [Acidaminococcus sp.]|jgi:uncharacterized membrane protein (DUF441 family)|nr:DUF441 domain-containing protein [Acidaminococcus sp.]MCI2100043.1 DUF441 domain-containing protein [Acidaminococcus sp.]MCI2114359.1 DUF441 domain-containing protein [Acidaminococcus sp.]MCI2116254.1 DUF441 domain-containing protein [Acidaminococcus sp.]
MQGYLILIGLGLIGYFGHNMTVTYSSAILVVLKLILSEEHLAYVGGHGMNWGIVILTAGMLSPIALGKIGIQDFIHIFKSPVGIASLVSGIIVALLGRWGLDILTKDPQLVASVMIGTVIGVVVLKGIAVGPLIASGILYVFLKIFHYLFS